MRTIAAIVLALAVAAPAAAQPSIGIDKPENESSLNPRELGAQLFAGNCSSCHGSLGGGVAPPSYIRGAGGVKGQGPSLRGVGALAADFYLRTGYMPLGDPHDQPWTNRTLWNVRERRALTQYVASLGAGPGIPHPHPERGSVSEGQQLFTEHCAGCHQVAGSGGMLTGARVPTLTNLDPVEIAEAVRIGPYVMPTFTQQALSDSQLDSVIAYIGSSNKHDNGGWALGRVGPIPEGTVTWLIAAVALVALCMVIGTRLRRE
jgi:ubiquinol-cytochrome c reductase cytochrome c subunit